MLCYTDTDVLESLFQHFVVFIVVVRKRYTEHLIDIKINVHKQLIFEFVIEEIVF